MRVNAFCAIGVFFSLEANAIVDLAFYGIFIEIVKINSD